LGADKGGLLGENKGVLSPLVVQESTAMMADNLPNGKTPSLAELAASLGDYVLQAARDGLPAHEVE
jgi:hypothetical protein